MNTLYESLMSIDEPYAAGLFETPEKGVFYRQCRGIARWYKTIAPLPYRPGKKLYPCGNTLSVNNLSHAVRPDYCLVNTIDFDFLREKCEKAGCEEAYQAMKDFDEVHRFRSGWLHGAPNYQRIVDEGLDSYRARVEKNLREKPEKEEFYEGLLLLLDAMKDYHDRCVTYLTSVGAPEELIAAMKKVPFRKADTYYEGLVAWNVIFYFDQCDNLGNLDRSLIHLYRGEDLTDVIRDLYDNIDEMDRWTCNIGPEVNAITLQAIRAHHGRRPLLAFRVNEDTPEEAWALALQTLKKGDANPSFYNDRGIHDMLHERFPRIPEEDLRRFCTCGCTETNIFGMTRAGGVDGNINLLKIFEDYLYENLPKKASFEDFFDGLCLATKKETEKFLDELEAVYRYHSIHTPSPMRTLFIDDCLDKGLDYNAGGARYTWTMNSDSGLINVIDSLAALKALFYDEKRFSADEFLRLLKAEDPAFFELLNRCPCFGTDVDWVDRLGAEYTRRCYTVYREKKPTLEFLDGFMITEHQFLRYDSLGAVVGPTPDGRRCGQPSCDSIAALRGKAVEGPTAMLSSSSKLPQNLAEGISVCNLTLSKKVCESPAVLRSLVLGYFAMGGMQLQVTVTSPEELKDAMAHPENHRDLIVRVGGYSDYFVNLTPELRQAVLDRNIHELEN